MTTLVVVRGAEAGEGEGAGAGEFAAGPGLAGGAEEATRCNVPPSLISIEHTQHSQG